MNVRLVWWKQPEFLAQPPPVVVFYPPVPRYFYYVFLLSACSRTNSLICQSNILYIWEIKPENSAKKYVLLEHFIKVFSAIENITSGSIKRSVLEQACLD